MAWQDDLTPAQRKKLRAKQSNISDQNQIGGKSSQNVTIHVRPPEVVERRYNAMQALQDIIETSSGILKITTGDVGEAHITLKFSQGIWRNHYVYWFKKPEETLSQALIGLAGKVAGVHEGRIKPTPDSYAR